MPLPLARRAAATVRRPWTSSVPVNNVISFLHVGAVNNGRKTVRTSIMGSGRGMNILLDEIVRWSASILPQKALMPGSFPKLYKVKLRGCVERLQKPDERGQRRCTSLESGSGRMPANG